MRVFLNPHCNYGKGLYLWRKIEKELHKLLGEFDTENILSPETIVSQVSKALNKGEKFFIAAGGDGTVNLLLNALMSSSTPHPDLSGLTIGAIGLGSSNDFHKPFRHEAFIKGIPVRIDFPNAFLCDVIHIKYPDIQGRWITRFCLINASVGITAVANAIFNSRSPDNIGIKMLQKVSVEAAIATAALLAIFTSCNIPCLLNVNEEEQHKVSLTNLGIIKNPHFAGSLCYDTPIGSDDGKIGVNLCSNLTKLEAIRMLIALYNHRFHGLPKTRSWIVTRAVVKSARFFVLEIDGEVYKTNYAEFSVIPKSARCCR